MKSVLGAFLALFVLAPCLEAMKCGEFRGCVTKDHENAAKSDGPVECDECAAWGCTIDKVLYGGAGCKSDPNVCAGHPGAIHFSCKDDPTCAIKKLLETRSDKIDRSVLVSGTCNPDPSTFLKPSMISKFNGYKSGKLWEHQSCAKSCKSGRGKCGTFLLPGDIVTSETCGHGNHCYCNL